MRAAIVQAPAGPFPEDEVVERPAEADEMLRGEARAHVIGDEAFAAFRRPQGIEIDAGQAIQTPGRRDHLSVAGGLHLRRHRQEGLESLWIVVGGSEQEIGFEQVLGGVQRAAQVRAGQAHPGRQGARELPGPGQDEGHQPVPARIGPGQAVYLGQVADGMLADPRRLHGILAPVHSKPEHRGDGHVPGPQTRGRQVVVREQAQQPVDREDAHFQLLAAVLAQLAEAVAAGILQDETQRQVVHPAVGPGPANALPASFQLTGLDGGDCSQFASSCRILRKSQAKNNLTTSAPGPDNRIHP